jgi:hypothetical protein
LAKEKGSKKGKIGAIEEFMGLYPEEWLLLEVLEVNEYEELAVGRMIAHDPLRAQIYEALRGTTIKDVALIYSGCIPKKGTTVMF